MQSSSQLVDALIRNRPAERMAVNDSPWGDTIKKWICQGYPTNEKGDPVDVAEHFKFDLYGCGGWFDWHPRRGFSEILQETDEWKVVRNGSGAALKWWKEKSGTPEHIDFLMTSREVWDKEYRPHILGVDRERLNIQGARENLERRRKEGYWTFFGHHFIWEGMRSSLGDYTMYTSLVADPGWIHDYNRVYTDFYKAHYKILLEEAGLPDGIWIYEDLGYRGSLFCSPKCLSELIFPYFAEVVAFFHSYDLPVILHTCGYTEPAIDLVVEAGFDGINPMEAKAGNDLFRIAERYKDKLLFVGGLDARILETNDRGTIRQEVIRHIQGMKDRGARWVFGSDHSLSTNIDYASFQYALEVYREHGAY